MCEAFPGPRCSNHTREALLVAHTRWQEAVKKHGDDNLDTQHALAHAQLAQAHYESSPEGIRDLEKKVEANPEDAELASRLKTAKITRENQLNSLREDRLERPHHLATVWQSSQAYFDQEELQSVIEASREGRQKEAIRRGNITTETSAEDWKKYLDKLEAGTPQTAENKEALAKLRAQTPPDSLHMTSYQAIAATMESSKRQLAKQFSAVSAMTGAPAKVVADYYDAYREQYKNEFADLPEKQQPNPPKQWVRGKFGYAGYTQSPDSRLAPRDPASMYAIYRLRNDPKAIPDYLKTSQQIVSVDIETSSPQDESNPRAGFDPKKGHIIEIGAQVHNQNGKLTKTYSQLVSPPAAHLEAHGTGSEHIHKISVKDLEGKPNLAKIAPEVKETLDGKILLAQNAPFEKAWLKEHLDGYEPTNVIDTLEVARKHHDLPNYTLQNIAHHTKSPYPNGHRALNDATAAASAYFSMVTQARKTWESKTARANAPVATNVPSSKRR